MVRAPDPGTLLDDALDGLVTAGWEAAPVGIEGQDLERAVGLGESGPVVVAALPVAPVVMPEDDETSDANDEDGLDEDGLDEDGRPRLPDIGALAQLAAGQKSATEIAAETGVSVKALQSQLATTLREMDPAEVNKALGIQAVEQQLKSGALYGAVLASLVSDMMGGRLKQETKLELAKMLARVGKVEPREDRSVGAGSGFVLNINLGAAEPVPVVIEAEEA